ncbi:uncharacterized protein LOC130736156 [Lotus japonicus]|uniref:uncharacterized protein LOC130736156 n=1 Tax=Lotus japonicus TaxID=34305 RepID=UPI00258E7D6A|nr:uncharacterized protein LOC130736156 [Lotus japonicus]
MATSFDNVGNLKYGKEYARILVKLIRFWYTQGFTNSKLPLSLELGSKIHVTIKKTLMYKFERIITDGKVWEYRTSRHAFKLSFKFKTEVRPKDQMQITTDPYTFISFPDIITPDYDISFLVGKLSLNQILL